MMEIPEFTFHVVEFADYEEVLHLFWEPDLDTEYTIWIPCLEKCYKTIHAGW